MKKRGPKSAFLKYGFPSIKKFLKADLPSELFYLIFEDEKREYDYFTKYLMRHRNCPEDIRGHFFKHPKWYARLFAYLSGPSPRWQLAIGDPHWMVRRAGYRCIPENAIDNETYLQLVKSDNGYPRKKIKQ